MKEYIKLKRRIVYRGDVYNAIEGERINVLPKVFDSEYMNGIHDGLKKALSTLANDVKDIPAADVVEVRHGKWVAGREIGREFVGSRTESVLYDEWGCNCCGLAIRTPYKPIYKYCPNCGAKMDGGDNP